MTPDGIDFKIKNGFYVFQGEFPFMQCIVKKISKNNYIARVKKIKYQIFYKKSFKNESILRHFDVISHISFFIGTLYQISTKDASAVLKQIKHAPIAA